MHNSLGCCKKVYVKPLLRTPLIETSAESVYSFQTFLNARHSSGVTYSNVIIRTEGNARDSRYFFGFEQTSAEIRGLQAGSRDIGKQVESPFGVHAGESRDGIQFFPGESATFVELIQPDS